MGLIQLWTEVKAKSPQYYLQFSVNKMGGSFSCCYESSVNAENREYEAEEERRLFIPQLRQSHPDHPVSVTEITNLELASENSQFFFSFFFFSFKAF